MNTQLFIDAAEAATFMTKHHPPAREWVDVIGWCAWYISNGFLGMIRHQDGTIAAMAAARPVNCYDDGLMPFKHVKDGQTIFVDLLIIDGPQAFAIPGFGFLLFKRFGDRKEIAFTRKSVHSYDGFMRNMGRIKHSVIGEPQENVNAEPTTARA